MGILKHAAQEQEDRKQIAIDLCIENRALRECEDHEGAYIDLEEYSDDYDELTSLILKNNPEALTLFKSLDEMKVSIREAMTHAGDECSSCEKNSNS